MSIYDRPLQGVSMQDLEKVIGEAVSALTGKTYEAYIPSLNFYTGDHTYDVRDMITMTLELFKSR